MSRQNRGGDSRHLAMRRAGFFDDRVVTVGAIVAK